MIDLRPATETLAELVAAVGDDQLTAPTPCADTTVGGLLDHIDGFATGFIAAAAKQTGPAGSGPSADPSRLDADWRRQIPRRLAALADAWADPAAWDGTTTVAGLELPGEVAGVVALDELIVHSWDIAVSSGQRFTCPDDLVAAATGFVAPIAAANPSGAPGLFGPPVAVAADASPLDQLLGLTGRDPHWRPSPAR